MIDEFILLRKKVHEISEMYHQVMPDHYEHIDRVDISISLNFTMDAFEIRNNCYVDNVLFFIIPVEWMSMTNNEIKTLIIKISKLYHYNEL